PYTKVEESFNMQATHDILVHGADLSKYDHHEFPGVVPRTFLGPIFLSLSLLLTSSLLFATIPVARLWLGWTTCLSLSIFRRALSRATNAKTGRIFLLICACQFHLVFWASRTLPNLFAFPLVTIALARWVDSGAPQTLRSLSASERAWSLTESVIWFTVAAAIFRSEVAGLAAPLLVCEVLRSRAILPRLFICGLIALALSIVTTVLVDSYFWREWPMWPEWKVFFFNAIQQRSSEWGTSPWHAYWTSLIPRIAHVALLPAMAGLYLSGACRRWLGPAVIFVGAYSMIEHKEWRFILYILPLINACAAVGVDGLWRNGANDRTKIKSLFLGLILSSCLLAAMGTWIMVGISSWNYPGGYALARLHSLVPADHRVHVHMDTATAMTGASRFGEQRHPLWTYAKDENVLP
ncbi:GPI mannosyltransferase, partial [Piptocephalis cylindrospora]